MGGLEKRGHTLNVTSRLSPSSNTVDLTCFPSSIRVIPTYKETFNMSLNTPSALITIISIHSGAQSELIWKQMKR